MAVTEIFDWDKLLGIDPSKQKALLESELDIKKDYDEFSLLNELSAKKQSDAYEYLLQILGDTEDYSKINIGYDKKGKKSDELKRAEKTARLADIYGVDLESFDPDNPTLSKYYASNVHDWENTMDDFETNIPEEYMVSYKPEGGVLRNIASGVLGVGQNLAQQIAYQDSYKRATENMRAAGMSGKEIEDQLRMNQSYHKSKQNLLDKILNVGHNTSLYNIPIKKINVVEGFQSKYPDIVELFKSAEPKYPENRNFYR